MVDPFVQSQQNTAASADNEHTDTQPAFGGSVDAFDAMSVGPYQPEPLSVDPFAVVESSTHIDTSPSVVEETNDSEDPFVRMGREESEPIGSPFSEATATPSDTVDPFIVGDVFDHSLTEATVVDKVVKKEEKPQKQVISTPKKTVPAIADPVTVVEPPLEPENTVASQPDIAPVSPIAEEREEEPTADLSPLLQKLAILVTNIRAIITEDPTLSSGISLVGGNSGVSEVTYIIHLDDDDTGVRIDKKETAHTDGSESEHALHFYNAGDALIVRVNDVELFHEKEIQDSPADTMQISDKINKFIFLTDNYLSDMRKKNAAAASQHDALEAFQQF